MNRGLLFSIFLVISAATYTPPIHSMVAELSAFEQGVVAAIQKGSHSTLVQAFAAHESELCGAAGAALKSYFPNANQAVGDVKTAAEMVSVIAGFVPGGQTVAAVAGDVESVAAAAQQGMGSAKSGASTAGGSASTAAKNSPVVQAALDAEKQVQAGSGIRSRLLAAGICVFSVGGIGLEAWNNWYATNSSSSENENQQRISAYLANLPTYAGLLGTAVTSGYYAITNQWQKNQVAAAKVTTAAVTNHVNTTAAVTDALNQVKQKQGQ